MTRFIIVTNQKIFTPDASKISICFELPHQSGSLYQILSHFIYNDLNMTKIESRPVEGKRLGVSFLCGFRRKSRTAGCEKCDPGAQRRSAELEDFRKLLMSMREEQEDAYQ